MVHHVPVTGHRWHLPGLCAEIVVSVLEAAYEKHSSHKDFATRILVYKSWLVATLKILYHCV